MGVEEMVGSFQVFAQQYDHQEQVAQGCDLESLKRRPVFLMTSRGELGLPYQSNTDVRGDSGVQRGAYVVHECYDKCANIQLDEEVKPLPDIILIGSGQDVALAMQAKELLLEYSAAPDEQLLSAQSHLANLPLAYGYCDYLNIRVKQRRNLKIRVVSMPCWELFDEQDASYQESVLLSNHDNILRVYIEKAATKNTGHDKYANYPIVMSSYGLSGKAADVEKKFEFTPECIAAEVWGVWKHRSDCLPR